MATSPGLRRIPRLALPASHAALMAAILCIFNPAVAAKAPSPKRAQAETVDFEKLAQHRPRKCSPDADTSGGPAGWKELPALCVWQGRLQMRRWQASEPAPDACLARPAGWLAWQRPRLGLRTGAPGAAWHSVWKSQYLAGQAEAGTERIAIVEMREPGQWTATEWTWSPSPRAPTRAWQQGRWELLAGAASKTRAIDPGPASPLRRAWEQNLKGRAGEITADGWRFNSEGKCLRMIQLPAANNPLPLPHAREDARLEQRATMQIQLARRHPQATFLMPFRLLDAPAGAPRAGAKYAAIWVDRTAVTGQIWIPRKSNDPDIRAQLVANLPARYDTPAGLVAGTGAARAIEHELTGIAASWSADHER